MSIRLLDRVAVTEDYYIRHTFDSEIPEYHRRVGEVVKKFGFDSNTGTGGVCHVKLDVGGTFSYKDTNLEPEDAERTASSRGTEVVERYSSYVPSTTNEVGLFTSSPYWDNYFSRDSTQNITRRNR